jgi:hypothetical protein
VHGEPDPSYGFCNLLKKDFDDEPEVVHDFMNKAFIHPMCPTLSSSPSTVNAYQIWYEYVMEREGVDVED